MLLNKDIFWLRVSCLWQIWSFLETPVSFICIDTKRSVPELGDYPQDYLTEQVLGPFSNMLYAEVGA